VTAVHAHQTTVMDTVLSIQIVDERTSRVARRDREAAIERAVGWFKRVEQDCSRFDARSELRRLCAMTEQPVRPSALLFQALRFAVAVAEDTDGAFDPTVGALMRDRGFDVNHRTGERDTKTATDAAASFRDITVDDAEGTITLHRPLLLDLGGVAKGLAIDLAARELGEFGNFAIDAGGDLFLAGLNPEGQRWSVGIRHPRSPAESIEQIRLSNAAVCTSGDYERKSAVDAGHHLVDPRTRAAAANAASATVVAASAMVADALATAAFVVGPAAGIALAERHDAEAMVITPTLEIHRSAGWAEFAA
jgi:thiamine biosynthesis lipoprotein